MYCASKAAVDFLTKGMRIDLLPAPHPGGGGEPRPGRYGILGEVRFKGDTARAEAVYQGFEPLHATDIADLIQFMVTRPPHVNLAEVLILPTAQGAATAVHKVK